jgi:hypothetical protein
VPFYYGDGKSIRIWSGSLDQPVPVDEIVPADLTNWAYRPLPHQVAVDPVLGRILFPPGQTRRQGVWVSYHYGFSADIGGGEYQRTTTQPHDAKIYSVGEGEAFGRISDALQQWIADAPVHAVIEIRDSGAYVERIQIALKSKQTLQLRAASGARPVLRLLDWQTSAPDSLDISGEASSWMTLDGLLITGRGVRVEGDLSGVAIRHCTLVPGWALGHDCRPLRPTEPSLELVDAPACLTIEHSIVGAIQVDRDEVKRDPLVMRIRDSIVDATGADLVAVGAPASLCAHASIVLQRCTVIGEIQTRAIDLAENCILIGTVRVCRRQSGCVRFSYVRPGSRTPRRYECQPDLVEKAAQTLVVTGKLSAAEGDALVESERLRVRPQFTSTRYGQPAYCQLAARCAAEIKRGADDESEIGVFHDLYQFQRADNLFARMTEYTPAGMDVGLFFAT